MAASKSNHSRDLLLSSFIGINAGESARFVAANGFQHSQQMVAHANASFGQLSSLHCEPGKTCSDGFRFRPSALGGKANDEDDDIKSATTDSDGCPGTFSRAVLANHNHCVGGAHHCVGGTTQPGHVLEDSAFPQLSMGTIAFQDLTGSHHHPGTSEGTITSLSAPTISPANDNTPLFTTHARASGPQIKSMQSFEHVGHLQSDSVNGQSSERLLLNGHAKDSVLGDTSSSTDSSGNTHLQQQQQRKDDNDATRHHNHRSSEADPSSHTTTTTATSTDGPPLPKALSATTMHIAHPPNAPRRVDGAPHAGDDAELLTTVASPQRSWLIQT